MTGGAGYVGSVVAHQLVEAGHETVVLDNLAKGHEEAPSTAARRVFAVSSGSASTIYAPAPVSLPARYFSLSAVRLGG
ncbi:MAG TPA: NAD-dependent epimerase/dehydratase family protein [Rubrobacteraceae bacterium]|nr:NAD-dependent epimerase/dehydratase family protein [Rubrobacteraceae bacterium]